MFKNLFGQKVNKVNREMELSLKDKIALVTGSTDGIGLEIARSLLQEGARVAICGRTSASVDKAIDNLSIFKKNIIPIVSDNGTEEGCRKTISLLPDADILINNLGIYGAVSFLENQDDSWYQHFEINIMSAVRLSRHYLKGMLERNNGRVVFISSEAAISPVMGMPQYSATKTMQLSIARSLADLTKGKQVTVNSVLPGPTRTKKVEDYIKSLFPSLSFEEAEKKFVEENYPTSLINRLVNPQEIGQIVSFLCSEKASIINGSCIRGEGGILRNII